MSLIGVVGEIIGIVIGLFVANNILSWNIPFIIPHLYLQYLPYSIGAIIWSGIAKICMHLSPWYRGKIFFGVVAQLIGIYSLYMLILLFPFNFLPINGIEINEMIRFGLYIAIIGISLGIIISLVKLFKPSTS